MKKNKLLLLVTALVYLFLIGPLLVIMAASFSDTNYLKFPGEGRNRHRAGSGSAGSLCAESV